MSDTTIERVELEVVRAHRRIDETNDSVTKAKRLAVQNREQLIEISGRDGTNGKIGELRRDLCDVRGEATEAKERAAAAEATARAEAQAVAEAAAKERDEIKARLDGLEKIGRKVIAAGVTVGAVVGVVAQLLSQFW